MSAEYLDPKIVGEVITHFRKNKKISQEVLSGLSDIGRTHLSAIERGERKPKFRIRDQIFLPYIMVEFDRELDDLPLESVMVGAKNNSDIAVRGMKYFLRSQGLDIPVLLSDIPLRY